jgi:hypothetical protein
MPINLATWEAEIRKILKPAQGNSSAHPVSKKPITKIDVGPELKPQYQKKKSPLKGPWSISTNVFLFFFYLKEVFYFSIEIKEMCITNIIF